VTARESGKNIPDEIGYCHPISTRLTWLKHVERRYMLIQYADPTDSRQRSPFQEQADGSWKKLSDPANKGGDDNVYYEDKCAFLWPINNSVKGFDQLGCIALRRRPCAALLLPVPQGTERETSLS
jgi:hypothetical protein